MANSLLGYLQAWYESKCDGGWDHRYGITIDTLDNPGWIVFITGEQEKNEKKLFIDKGDDNWMSIDAAGSKFQGGGIKKARNNFGLCSRMVRV